MILNFRSFNENKSSMLFYSAFDWDDNILYMPTVIHMERKDKSEWIPEDVSTSKFSQIRTDKENWRYLNEDPEQAFADFRDYQPFNVFLRDAKKAIADKKFGPSWNDFIECLSNGSLFAIITARGHNPETMKKVVEWIIDNVLTEEEIYSMYNHLIMYVYHFTTNDDDHDRVIKGTPSKNKIVQEYLNNCDFIGVSNPNRKGTAGNPEKAKEEALLEFQSRINEYASRKGLKAMIGFSDDDIKNVKHIEDLFDNLNKEQFPNIIGYVVKGTKDPNNITKKVRYMESKLNETSQQTPGLESSVLKFTQFGNMTGHLYPQGPDQRQDDEANSFRRATKYLVQTSKEIIKKKKRKKRINPLK